jgi:hypothetical protein
MTGASSQFQLTRLAAKYNEMQTNGRLLSNRASLSVVRQRIEKLLERIDLNEAPERMSNLQRLWNEFRRAEDSGQKAEAVTLKGQIDAEFEAAYHDYAAWKQMFEALELDRKLVESEVKIIKDIHAVMTAEDAYELGAKLLAAIIETVGSLPEMPDKAKSLFMRRIQFEFTRLVGDNLGGGTGEGTGGSAGEVLDPGPD